MMREGFSVALTMELLKGFAQLSLALMQPDGLCGFFSHAKIDEFNADGERHRKINVAFRNMDSKTLKNQGKAHHYQEGKRKNLYRRMGFDEITDRLGRHQHHQYRQDNCDR